MADQIVIVGGGIVGLTLGAALGRAGVRTTVVDHEPVAAMLDQAFDGRVSAIAPASRAVFDGLGIWDRLAGDAQPIEEIRVSDGDSPLFAHYDRDEVGAEALGYIVENRWIRRALIEAVEAHDCVRLLDGRAVAGLERGPVDARLRLDDGAVLTAALVVAADGRRSLVRRHSGIGALEVAYDQTGIVATIAHGRPHRGIAQERFLPAGPFAVLPMTGSRSSIVWTERADVARRILALPRPEFEVELASRFTDYLGDLAVEGPVFSYPLTLTLAERYVLDRLALAGDAAHAIHPIAGQGLNLGIRDAAALTGVIVDAVGLGLDPGASTLLARYTRARRADNFAMLAVTDGLNRLFSNDRLPLRLGRRLGLAAVNRFPALKRVLIRHAMGEPDVFAPARGLGVDMARPVSRDATPPRRAKPV